jgi:hypothetical protein
MAGTVARRAKCHGPVSAHGSRVGCSAVPRLCHATRSLVIEWVFADWLLCGFVDYLGASWWLQEERVLESATVVAWGYVAEMQHLALAHAARPEDFPDDADDDPAPGLDEDPGLDPTKEAVEVEEWGELEPCAACLSAALSKQHRSAHHDTMARRTALSRCFGRGHILVQRTGAPPQVRAVPDGQH